jgi:hypothetical protein
MFRSSIIFSKETEYIKRNSYFDKRRVVLVKNRIITGAAAAVLGVLISVIPTFVLPVCNFCHGMAMKCSGAVKAEYGIGVAILFFAVLISFAETNKIRFWISTALALAGMIAAVIGKTMLCGGSCKAECSCSSAAPTVMTVLGILTTVIFIINAIYLQRRKNT